MNWLTIALLAPVVYTIVTFIDKYIVEDKIDDYKIVQVYVSVIAVVVGTIFWLVTGRPVLSLRDAVIVLSTGVITSWSNVLYFKALTMEETSKINFLFQMFPIFTLIMGFIFLGEVITLSQFIGFLLILSAATLASIEEKQSFQLTKAFWLILVFDFVWASAGILMKFAINANSFAKILSYESWGIAIGGVLLYLLIPAIRKSVNKSFGKVKRDAVGALVIEEITFVTAKTLTFFAFSLGPVALVSVLEGTQVFYAILLGGILTLIAPKIFKEDITKRALIKKALLALVLFGGVVLL